MGMIRVMAALACVFVLHSAKAGTICFEDGTCLSDPSLTTDHVAKPASANSWESTSVPSGVARTAETGTSGNTSTVGTNDVINTTASGYQGLSLAGTGTAGTVPSMDRGSYLASACVNETSQKALCQTLAGQAYDAALTQYNAAKAEADKKKAEQQKQQQQQQPQQAQQPQNGNQNGQNGNNNNQNGNNNGNQAGNGGTCSPDGDSDSGGGSGGGSCDQIVKKYVDTCTEKKDYAEETGCNESADSSIQGAQISNAMSGQRMRSGQSSTNNSNSSASGGNAKMAGAYRDFACSCDKARGSCENKCDPGKLRQQAQSKCTTTAQKNSLQQAIKKVTEHKSTCSEMATTASNARQQAKGLEGTSNQAASNQGMSGLGDALGALMSSMAQRAQNEDKANEVPGVAPKLCAQGGAMALRACACGSNASNPAVCNSMVETDSPINSRDSSPIVDRSPAASDF